MTNKTRLRQTSDGLVNVMSGLGTSKSKSANNFWSYGANASMQYQQLEAAYQDNWIAQKIVDVRAEDMTRQWRRIKSDGAEQIASLESELDVKSKVFEGLKWSRLYGGSAILMLTDQDPTKPLNVNKLKKGSLKKLIVFDRWDVAGQDYNWTDMEAENYELPTSYHIGRHASQTIHHSHMVRFPGTQLPRRLRALNNGWGDSVLRKCLDDVSEMVAAKTGIADLLQEANVDVVNREGLTEDLASDEDDAIIQRYALFSQMKSVVNLALLDANETYSRQTLNLTGVAPILEQMLTYISGAADTPVTRMFGTSAKGMNATGEGDLNNYYDSISASQSSYLETPMRQLDEVLVRSALGSFPASFDYVWNPLETPDDVSMAQAQLLQQQKAAGYLADGIVTKSQVMRELQASEQYQYDDAKLDELEELEDSNMFEDLPPVTPESDTIESMDAETGYVSLRVSEDYAKELEKAVRDAGISSGISNEDLHVTMMYSRNSNVDTSPSTDAFKAIIGKPEIIGEGEYRALVLNLKSDALVERHRELKEAGGVHSYPDFKPHVSVKYKPTDEDLKRLIDNPVTMTEILLGDERFGNTK